MLRVGVLASGSGSNFQALAEDLASPDSPARVVALICNVPGAPVLERAGRLGIAASLFDHRAFSDRAAFEARVVAALGDARVELVCLAGFMRLLGPTLLAAFPGRILNIHPSLLPAFPGLHGVRQALEHGVAITGATVHGVDAGLDSGPIVIQAAVPVRAHDTEAELAARIHAQEHRIYPQAVRWFAQGRVQFQGRRAVVSEQAPASGALVAPLLDAEAAGKGVPSPALPR